VAAVHKFGGEGPLLHLAHANGFPPGSYHPLAEALAGRYQVVAFPSRPLWPGSRPENTPTWRPMAGDLVRALDDLGARDVIGVGHSLGGVLTLWAAIDRPDLFAAVVLIEPVLLPPTWLGYLRLLRWLGLGRRQPLVQGALRRRRTWASRDACYDYFRAKAFFARWSDESLGAYVEAGTRPRADGQVELVYPLRWEAHIFATTPLDIWRDLPHLRTLAFLRKPILVLRGEHSETFVPAAQARVARLLPGARCQILADAGHLLPMERPAETAVAINAFLDDVGA
jgi:pimeloyl-ACP methyl ester carboxylesterase